MLTLENRRILRLFKIKNFIVLLPFKPLKLKAKHCVGKIKGYLSYDYY